VVKERLAKEAEALAESTEWGPTAGRYRELMRQWKSAGPAPKEIDDELWRRFRGAQDTFFGARDAANAALDAEFADNAVVKEALLVEAEALVPVGDLDAAKRAFRDIAERWDAAGKVPRDRMKELEGRIRAVETAIRSVEDEQWRRSDPEKSARADDMVSKLEAAIAQVEADLDKARAAGNEKKIKELEENLASRQSFLDMARRVSADYS
jgi:DNA repair exonuclease SbcCD ATPase subunit